MKANELRIGNWVSHENENDKFYFRVEEITEKGINVTHNGGRWFLGYNKIEPITVTREILFKSGFFIQDTKFWESWMKTFRHSYPVTVLFVKKGKTEHWSYVPDIQINMSVDFNYLHQLQNIVFTVTGQELDIKF